MILYMNEMTFNIECTKKLKPDISEKEIAKSALLRSIHELIEHAANLK